MKDEIKEVGGSEGVMKTEECERRLWKIHGRVMRKLA